MSTSFDFDDHEDWEFFYSDEAGNVAPNLKLQDTERGWLDAYRKRLYEEFPGLVVDVMVYGPRSRGRLQPNPGLNMLIILSEGDWETKDAVGSLGHLVDMEDYFAAPTIMVYTKEEWLDRERFGSNIFRNVMQSHVCVL